MPSDALRRFSTLFERLVAPVDEHESSPDEQSARRLLAQTLHNYLDLTGPGGIERIERALPWLRFHADWGEVGASLEGAIDPLMESGALRALDARFVESRLTRLSRGGFNRTPAAPGDAGERLDAISDLASLEASFDELDQLNPVEFLDELYGDSKMLAVAIELVGRGATTDLTRKLPDWFERLGEANESSNRAQNASSNPLWRLAALESGRDHTHPVALADDEIPRDVRSFEVGLARKLDELGFGRAVRLAASMPSHCADIDVAALAQTTRLRWDEPSIRLAIVLTRVRGRCLEVVRGNASLESLQPWRSYLLHDIDELARSRQISAREARGYAHYSLHLLNICDLSAVYTEQDSWTFHDDLFELAEGVRMSAETSHKRVPAE